jgi:hypothetical protein
MKHRSKHRSAVKSVLRRASAPILRPRFLKVSRRYAGNRVIERDPLSILLRQIDPSPSKSPFTKAQIDRIAQLLCGASERRIKAFLSDVLLECAISYRIEASTQSNALALRRMKRRAIALEKAIKRFLAEWETVGPARSLGAIILCVHMATRRTVPLNAEVGQFDLINPVRLAQAVAALKRAQMELQRLSPARPGAPHKAALDHLLIRLGKIYTTLTGRPITPNRTGTFINFAHTVFQIIAPNTYSESTIMIIVSRTRRLFAPNTRQKKT